MTAVAEFASLLNETMGLSADTVGLSVIESAVRARLSACKSKDLSAYWERVHACDGELQELIDAVIVPETWFFRDREAFAGLAREACSRRLPERAEDQLRLLSLPCATGEEPYSMAMALLAAGLPGSRFQIDAVDISVRLLKRARDAAYGRNSFRGRDLEYRDRFFEPSGAEFRLAESVRRQVQFHHGNLLDLRLAGAAASYDFIFCRNVLIYFDRATQDRAVQALTRLLKPDGLLFVGPSESGLILNHGFVSAKLPLAFAFRHKPAASLEPEAAPAASHKPRRASTRKLAANGARPAARAAARAAVRPAPARRPAAALARPAGSQAGLEEIVRLADEGRLDEAMQRCGEFLRTSDPSVRAYHLMGLLHDASGMHHEAEQYYRKALYLDPGHQEALVHLAFLLEKRGDGAGARRLHRRAKRAIAGEGA